MKMTWYLAVLLLTLCGSLAAQEFRATVTGRILDASGGAVPNATVTATNVGTNEVRTATTDGQGNYSIPLLPPGTYTLSVEAQGFKRLVREGITLQVGQQAGINLTLEVGAVTESVNVTAEAPLLETATASRVGVVTTQQVSEIPLIRAIRSCWAP